MTAPLRERLEAAIAHIHTYQGNPIQIAKHIATLTEALAALAEREKDAERYRAVRNGDAGNWKIGRYSGVVMWVLGEHADTAIDAAIKEGE